MLNEKENSDCGLEQYLEPTKEQIIDKLNKESWSEFINSRMSPIIEDTEDNKEKMENDN